MRNAAPKQKDNKRISKTVQRSIPIQCIHRDGIWEVGGKYSRTWRFLDINFSVADEDDKRNMLIDYCSLEKALPTDAITKISIVNKKLNPKSFEEEILLPLRGNALDSYRKEYNRVLADKAAEGNNIVQERYITVSVQRKSMEEARNFFVRIASDLSTNLKKLGSKLIELNNEERLALLHDFFRIGEEGLFSFDFDTLSRRGEDFKDSICPDSIQFHSNYFELSDNKVGRVLFVKGYPTYMPDSFLKSLTDVNRNMVISIDIQPVPTDVAIKRIQNKELSLDTDITRWQNKQNQNNNFSAVPPSNLTARRNDIREMLEDINTRDQRISLCVLTLMHIADTKEQLDADTETIRSIASGVTCNLSILTYQQEDGLNTCLPYGLRKIDALRTLTTESSAGLVPFSSQEIRHEGGIYYGVNATSRNLIICDRKQLLNANGFILGVSGGGKSFAAKQEIAALAMSTEDDILIVDPEREYAPLISEIEDSEVVQISADSPNHINAMDMSRGYGDGDTERPLTLKTTFMMSLCEQVLKPDVIGHAERSLISRCMNIVYHDYIREYGTPPTLREFREELLRQPEEEARSLALALELFTEGALNVFSHPTNVDMSKRVMLFDIFELDSHLKTVGMLVMLDAILNRVIENHKKGKRTWIYIDEIYLFFKNEYSATFLNESWKRFRKKGAAATGITQNVSDCLRSDMARNMLSNSEFLMMLSQAASDQKDLVDLLRISQQQLGYINNADTGHGLIKVGGSLIPFVNKFPKDTNLYRLMSTKPNEKFE